MISASPNQIDSLVRFEQAPLFAVEADSNNQLVRNSAGSFDHVQVPQSDWVERSGVHRQIQDTALLKKMESPAQSK